MTLPTRMSHRALELSAPVFLALGLSLVPSPGLAQDPVDRLNRCINSQFQAGQAAEINRELDLIDSCPDLAGDDGILRVDSLDQRIGPITSLNELLDARRFLRDLQARPPERFKADRASLQETLDALELEEQTSALGLWEEFLAWLTELLETEGEDDWGWLTDFLESLSVPGWVGKLIYYGSIAVILILAALIVINELRALGAARWLPKRRIETQAASGERPHGPVASLQWSDIQRLPLSQQPSAIVRLLIHTLIAQGIVPDNMSYTNYEFLRLLRTHDPERARGFGAVVAKAEPALYGSGVLQPEEAQSLARTAARIAATGDQGGS